MGGMEGGVGWLSLGAEIASCLAPTVSSLDTSSNTSFSHTSRNILQTVYILVFATNRSDERFGTAEVLPTGHRRHPNDMGALGEHFSELALNVGLTHPPHPPIHPHTHHVSPRMHYSSADSQGLSAGTHIQKT